MQAQKIIGYYERRWLVEEYREAWKSDGTNIEASRLQSKEYDERLVTIKGFIALRILQLKFAKDRPIEDIKKFYYLKRGGYYR